MSIQTRTWPILFKKSKSTKAINYWEIEVQGAAIITRFGRVDGKEQRTKDIIKSGKNLGRSNETTPEAQAEAEAASKFQKYLDKGYVEDRSGETEETATGINTQLFPQLSHEYKKHGHKIKWPAYGQPKFDGARMTSDRGIKQVSRKGKPLAVPERVQKDLKKFFSKHVTDGELYTHEFKADFGKLISAVRKVKGKSKDLDKVQYVIYDLFRTDLHFWERLTLLKKIFAKYKGDALQMAETVVLVDEQAAEQYFTSCIERGYEGIMIRNMLGTYQVDKRSYNVQKYKPLVDGEFRIVGVVEGRGKLAGRVATFTCEIDDEHGKRTFETVLKGDKITRFLEQCWEDKTLWKGKWMHVEYMMFTDAEKKPRHPRGLKIIDRRTF